MADPIITISSGQAIENGTIQFEVTLSEPATQAVTVELRTLEGAGTALGDRVDFNEAFSTVRINAGETSTTFGIRSLADNLTEADESVVVELFNPTNAVFPDDAGALRATGVILDDDGTGAKRALFVSPVQLVEGDDGSQQAVFEVTLSRPSDTAITLDYTTADGSAQAGTDYQALADSLTFAPGETMKAVAVPLIGDTVAEANEFFNLVFTPTAAIANGVEGAVGKAVILDDDTSAALPEISIQGGQAIENGTIQFEVTLSEPATQAVTVELRTLEGAGTALGDRVDFNEAFSTVRINAGETSTTFGIRSLADNLTEADESVVVELFNPTNAVFPDDAGALRATGVILDDDGTGAKRALFVSPVQLVEGDDGSQQAVFEVTLSRPSDTAITLDYTTADGSAQAGTDYQALADSLTFAPGETMKAVAVPLIGDTVAEANEFFNLVFTPTAAIANGVEGAVGKAVILDDDTSAALPEISIQGGQAIENGTIQFEVTLSEPATQAVTVELRTLEGAGTALGDRVDFNEAFSTVRINAGETSTTFGIRSLADNLTEADESVVVELFNPTNAVFPDDAGALRATGVILDDDGTGAKRALFVSPVQLVEGDDGSQQAVFEVTLSRPSDTAITLDYTTADGSAQAGTDYQALADSLTFAPGETMKAVAVPLIGDTVAEANEFFNLVFTPTAAIANGVEGAVGKAVILDDDTSAALPEISIQGGQAIENGTIQFEVTLSEPATQAVTVELRTLEGAGTALGDRVDFNEAFSTVRINAGETSTTFGIRSLADNLTEADESVVVELFNPTNAVFPDGVKTLQATGIILDDDGTNNKLGLFVENAQIVEGADGVTREVAVPIVLSRPADQELTLNFTTADGEATAGQDYTQTSGSVTFAPGETMKAAFVPILGDSVEEPNENFTLTVTPTAEIANGSDGATGTVTIIDGDVGPTPEKPVLALEAVNADQPEGNTGTTPFTFQVTRSGDLSAASTVAFAVTGTSADPAQADDFAGATLPSGVVNFAAGESEQIITVNVAGDTVVENDEGFTVSLSDPSDDTVIDANNNTANGVIRNDDGEQPPVVAIEAVDADQPEGDADTTAFTFRVTRSGDLSAASTVAFAVTGSGADPAQADDFAGATLPSGVVNFAAGESEQIITVDVAGDTVVENDEGFTVSLSDPTDATIDADNASAAGIIRDDDGGLPVVALEAVNADQPEGDTDTTAFTFQLTRSGDLSAASTVAFAVTGSGADPAQADDFAGATLPSGVVNFAAGESEQIVTVDVAGDTVVENDEGFTVSLSDPTDATIDADNASAAGIIRDDDGGLPVVALEAVNADQPEGDADTTAFTFRVTRSGDLSAASTVAFAVTGSGADPAQADDFAGATLPSGVVNFAAGESEQIVTVNVAGDTVFENDEGFTVSLSDPTDATIDADNASAAGLIRDDDGETVVALEAVNADQPEGDADTTAFTFRVTRSGDLSAASTVAFAVTGSGADPAQADDFAGATLPSGVVNFAAGESEQIIIVNVAGDTVPENDEGFTVTLSDPTDATIDADNANAAGLIRNEDPQPPTVVALEAVNADQTEGDTDTTAFTFRVTRSGDLSAASTVAFAVTGSGADPAQADDFAGATLPSGGVNFAAGESEQIITVNVAGDTVFENDEEFTVTLSDPTDATLDADNASAAGIIRNDDPENEGFSIRLGDAPVRVSRATRDAWEKAWTDPDDRVDITHKADLTDGNESYTDVLFQSSGSGSLAGGDIAAGDLGVSGQTLQTSAIRQEIDGTEGLRFELNQEATEFRFGVSRLFTDDEGTGFTEAGRVQLLNDAGELVAEEFFFADNAAGTQEAAVSAPQGFTQAVFSAGAFDGNAFVFGAYGNGTGDGFGSESFADGGKQHGSDYAVDFVEFEALPIVGVGSDPGAGVV
ncbi:Calx-beta domain-containing protein [Nitrococcus mobilis]|uniref:Cadherin domain/calx-beta domain protein n=1 Tax=Nitrococcus mobilis Nb-231 TaxID=314278 RepID=A4BQQ3_9GAMM|nr:Calx-beta domain-containing protein [Nitrococcus mobilis]EAR21903.1 cadherin domain/calx-beta domain protein [Nitrococcus mobilis Nb-231]